MTMGRAREAGRPARAGTYTLSERSNTWTKHAYAQVVTQDAKRAYQHGEKVATVTCVAAKETPGDHLVGVLYARVPLGSGFGVKGRFGVGLTVASDDVPCGGVERDGRQRVVQRRCGSVYDGVHDTGPKLMKEQTKTSGESLYTWVSVNIVGYIRIRSVDMARRHGRYRVHLSLKA